MTRTVYQPDSIEEELAVMEERDAEGEGVPCVSLDTRISELDLRPASTVGIGATVGDAIRTMIRDQVSAVVVVDKGLVAGIFTERDVMLRVATSYLAPDEVRIADRMTPAPETLRPDDAIAYVVSRMLDRGYGHVPVVDDGGRPLHILSMRDLMMHIMDPSDRRISTLPPEPFHGESRLDLGYG